VPRVREIGKVRNSTKAKNAHLALVTATAPTLENGKVPPRRVRNADRRSREHLTPAEMELLIVAAGKRGRHGHRDATLLLLGYRHGLRVSELVAVKWEQLDLEAGVFHVTRLKGGAPSTHPLRGPELRALRRLQREQHPASGYAFTSERGGPMTAAAVRKIITEAGRAAELTLALHPHMLRHSCGYKLAAEGIDTRAIASYLGHRRLENTARYTELAPGRFRDFWRD
jgi:type 1 fimbriae regulatory protein FimE